MRWNDLFADLEGQLGAAADAQFTVDVADRTRSERATITLCSRLAGAVGSPVAVALADGETVTGVLSDTAAAWILVNEPSRQSWIPIPAIVGISGIPMRVAGLSTVALRLTVGHALRALARDRAQVVVITPGGQYAGVITQVGADYVEIRVGDSRSTTVVPFLAIMRVNSVGGAR